MKLISYYIENFGGLSKYSLDFSEGVTSVQALNGFGKTTLAEFLRAMFYGFPRKAKTLDKSRRQKYTPWNGGKFGGNLVFEHEGVRYRLERTFGAAPKNDTFRLTDLATNRKSDRFSEEIGLELFQLDSDSFERSTYMPQTHEVSTLTTTGIQAKLGDLVEDAGDLGNYDKALLALRTKRSSFVPYKCSSCSVAEAAEHATRLQRELDQTEAKREQLSRCADELADLEVRLESKKEERKAVGQQKELAAAAEKRKILRDQYAQLMNQHRRTEETLSRLAERYPKGIPGKEDLDKMDELAGRLSVLRAQQITTPGDLEAEVFLRENESRFAEGVPQAGELDAMQQKCEAYNSLTARMAHLTFSDGEQKQYRTLKAVSETGMLEEEKIEDLAERNRLLLIRRAALESLSVPEEDRIQMRQLGEFFAEGVPTKEQIDEQTRNLARCEQLRRENAELAASRMVVPEKPDNGNVKLALILGAVGIIAGIVLLIMKNLIPGGILLGAGVLGLIAAAVLNSKWKQALARWQSCADADAVLQAKLEANEAEASNLEQEVKRFAGEEPAEGLARIRRNLERYLALGERLHALREKRSVLVDEIDSLDAALVRELEPLFDEVSDYDRAISSLRLARGQYLDLQSKKETMEAQRAKLEDAANLLRSELTAFGLQDGEFSQSLGALRRNVEQYVRAKEQVMRLHQRRANHEKEVVDTQSALNEIFDSFGLTQQNDLRGQIQQLREDARISRDASEQETRLYLQLSEFRAAHSDILDMEEPEQDYDPEHLRWIGNRLDSEIFLLTRSQVEQEQKIARLREDIDRIPQIRDELESWQEKRISDQKKADTLDAAMTYLEKARDSLTTSYLGPIRESFEKLLKLLMGEEQNVFISPDLDVQLERYGEARELAYFSAGQADLIVLGMRFALVDALFSKEKPFVILDDPFVNLDGQRTAQALEFLRELGKERQIIYLTCNSSRSL